METKTTLPTKIFPYLLVLCIAVFSTVFLYPLHFELSYMDTDFVDYCVAVATFDDADRLFPAKRSKFAALIPWLWSLKFGVLKGLAMGAVSAFVGCSLIVFSWGRRYSKPIGWLSLAIFLSMGPALAMSRMLNFYPEICLFLMLGAYMVHSAIQNRNGLSFLWGGVGVALCILSDVRGLMWGLLYIPVLVFFVGKSSLWTQRGKWLMAICSPIWLSWFVAWWSSHNHSTSFIRQADLRPLIDSVHSSAANSYSYPSEFVWGYGNPFDIPANVLFLWQQQSLALPPELNAAPSGYWLIMMFLCAFSCGIVTWTKRNEWPLIVILAPFALAFWSIGSHVESHVRFYSQALPVFSIPIALSCAGILQNNKRLIHMCCLLFPIIAAWASPHWSIEREISSKMLKQAFPEVQSLQKMQTRVGHAVHIQTLPLTNIERKIAADWDTVCTQALKKDGVWKLY